MKNLTGITVLVLAGALLACSSNASDRDPVPAGQKRVRLQERPSEGYRVQLGIFAQRKDAEKARDSFESRFGDKLPGIVIIPLFDSESQYRVASRPMTAADAEVACAKLIEEHQSCAVAKR